MQRAPSWTSKEKGYLNLEDLHSRKLPDSKMNFIASEQTLSLANDASMGEDLRRL
jgi:hypothetical protein